MTIAKICIATVCLFAGSVLHAQNGLAWDTQGNWHANHTQTTLRKGSDVAPGSLLTAEGANNASMIVLLPDGQRLIFECHSPSTCAQGFRVPALMKKPDDDVIELFRTIGQTLGNARFVPKLRPSTQEKEMIVALQNDNSILLKEALAGLPTGQYQFITQDAAGSEISTRPLKWSGTHDEARLQLPHAGVYRLQLFGNTGNERLRVTLLAISPDHYQSAQKSYMDTFKDLQEWNETFPGWPIHEWMQLYLEALSQDSQN